ncbi:uncharacterized protein LOC124810441 [Hydra vulgaris]|uniref:uncharacterized protein LOC124810441 n=1 Tax=Hydra vulgaris TaxID=6087 RepID=UPI001F5EDE0B|nr:uncharacterized protein LOC124810441 [Hydra vulgaris]
MAYNLIDDVLKRFKTDNLVDLNTFYETLLDTFLYNNNKMVSNEGLLSRFIDVTIRGNICAEVCIPSYLKDNEMHCIALRRGSFYLPSTWSLKEKFRKNAATVATPCGIFGRCINQLLI